MSEITPFVVLAAERTGSNLLAGLLDSHPAIVAGGELFNPVLRAEHRVPWPLANEDERKELADLRERDPVAFLDRLGAAATAQGRRAVGFKLMYFHADQLPTMRDHLVAERRFRVVHLKRRNLLRRFLSAERAKITGKWQRAAKDGPPAVQPKVTISIQELVRDVQRVESWQADYARLFAEHPILDVYYEDLAEQPDDVGREVVSFLGLDPVAELAVRYTKTGTDTLRDAVANYDEVKEAFGRWLAFFED